MRNLVSEVSRAFLSAIVGNAGMSEYRNVGNIPGWSVGRLAGWSKATAAATAKQHRRKQKQRHYRENRKLIPRHQTPSYYINKLPANYQLQKCSLKDV